MNHMGLRAGRLRLPLVAMSEENKTKLISILKENGVDKK
jgi:dihydrodipicolinate synthase/N-acetylneuraminate lyase